MEGRRADKEFGDRLWKLTEEVVNTVRKALEARREGVPTAGNITILLSKTLCPWAMRTDKNETRVYGEVESQITETLEEELNGYPVHHERIVVRAVQTILHEEVPKPFSVSWQWYVMTADGPLITVCPE